MKNITNDTKKKKKTAEVDKVNTKAHHPQTNIIIHLIKA